MFNAILYCLGGYEYIVLKLLKLFQNFFFQRTNFVKENDFFLEYSKIF